MYDVKPFTFSFSSLGMDSSGKTRLVESLAEVLEKTGIMDVKKTVRTISNSALIVKGVFSMLCPPISSDLSLS